MNGDELQFLKELQALAPVQQASRPAPMNSKVQGLLHAGFIQEIVRPDASGSDHFFVVGYRLTSSGEKALKEASNQA